MADVLDRRQRRPAPPLRDPRETLEPLLDELMRSHGFERAVVTPDLIAEAGRLGLNVPWRLALVTIMQFREHLADRQGVQIAS